VQVYLEPGEAIALDAGILVGEILDTFDNGHAPSPSPTSRPPATCPTSSRRRTGLRCWVSGQDGVTVRIGGPSCLAGDIIGNYVFDAAPTPGARIAFLDQAHYSMVKTNTFNGVPLPAIALWNSQSDVLKLVKSFD
jgi:carboxynorspermidine decarboxylase